MINRGRQSCPPREATIYRGLSAAADRFARRGKPKMPDTDKYAVVVGGQGLIHQRMLSVLFLGGMQL